MFFVVYMLSSIASRSSGRFSESFTSLSAPLNLTLLLGLGCGILSGFFYIQELWVLSIVLFVMVYLIENLRKPVGVAYLGSSIDKNALASVLSVDSQLKSLMAAVLAPLIGIFADLYGVGWGLMMISAAILIFAPLIMLKAKHKA